MNLNEIFDEPDITPHKRKVILRHKLNALIDQQVELSDRLDDLCDVAENVGDMVYYSTRNSKAHTQLKATKTMKSADTWVRFMPNYYIKKNSTMYDQITSADNALHKLNKRVKRLEKVLGLDDET